MLEKLQLPIHVKTAHPTLLLRGFKMTMRALRIAFQICERILSHMITFFVRTATLPYYRLYQFNTIYPLGKIAALASASPRDTTQVVRAISTWRTRKITELQFTTISCTVLAAAVIGAFSWTTIEQAYWLTHGFWHSSLILSVLGILLSASEVTVLHILGPVPAHPKPGQSEAIFKTYQPLLMSENTRRLGTFKLRRKMVFTWQGPLMFMAYSVCTFLAGLTVLVCTPLIRHEKGEAWNTGKSIAVMYVAVFVVAGALFVFCSFWVYHYVTLGAEGEHVFRDEGLVDTSGTGFGRVIVPYAENEPPVVESQQLRTVMSKSGSMDGFRATGVSDVATAKRI